MRFSLTLRTPHNAASVVAALDVYHQARMLCLGDNSTEWTAALADRNAVRLFQFSLSMTLGKLGKFSRLLSSEEQSRAARLKFPQLRDRFIAAHVGLRCVLGALLQVAGEDVQISTDEHGKPYIPQTDLHFNMTHAGNLAVVAVAYRRSVGVDIEQRRPLPDALDIAERFFAPAEFRRLQACVDPADREQAFFECWTRKEAYVKALGMGLSHPLSNFEVTFFPNDSFNVTGPGTERWFTQDIDVAPGYVGALVVEKSATPCELQKHMCVW